MNKQENVPALRFPEFTGNWVAKKLGDVTSWSSGGTPSKEIAHYWDGNIPWISASSMRGTQYYDSPTKITEAGLKSGSKLAKKGNLLILVRGSMLFNTIPIGIAMNPLSFNQDVKAIAPDETTTSYFILYWFISNENKVLNMVTGTGIGAGKLDLMDLKTLDLLLPSLPEQQKIATFLSSVDEKLQGLKKKKSLLEAYKKGMMQRLFSQTLRFKDDNGEGFPEWEEERIENLSLSISSGKSNIKESQEIGNVPFYGSTGIIGYSAKFDYTGKSILIARVGANAGFLYKVDGNYCVSDNTLIYKITENVNFNFIYFILSYENLNTLVFGSGQPLITGGQLKQLKLQIPTLPEQTKIANFLSAIDEKIAKVSQEIEQVTVWKKGLLQQLFV